MEPLKLGKYRVTSESMDENWYYIHIEYRNTEYRLTHDQMNTIHQWNHALIMVETIGYIRVDEYITEDKLGDVLITLHDWELYLRLKMNEVIIRLGL